MAAIEIKRGDHIRRTAWGYEHHKGLVTSVDPDGVLHVLLTDPPSEKGQITIMSQSEAVIDEFREDHD